MAHDPSLRRTSKFLSLVLRHRPELIGLTLDAQGWAEVDDLLTRLAAHGHPLDRATLVEVVATNDKQRFRLNPEQTRIRANQGHSIAVELGYEAKPPPAFLYHGTGQGAVASIWREGLRKQQRHHVHLSSDVATARQVGQRHGPPYLFRVRAAEMARAGYPFFLSDNGVWLTEVVPVVYLEAFGEE